MFIHEAIRSAEESKYGKHGMAFIRRKSWPRYESSHGSSRIIIKPELFVTNGPGNLMVVDHGNGVQANWSPTREDILADDWEVAKA